VSQHCADDVCQVATCGDGIQNQDESDEDCGGVCALEAPCELDELCNGGADCATYVCTSGHCAPDIVIVADDVIDDFEDQNIVIGSAGARIGNWYPYGDGTGAVNMAITTLPGTRGPASAFGLHTDGSGFTSWGSGVGADLKNSGGAQATKEPYDASAYAGVTFWARAETAAAVTLVLPNKDTDAAGDTCVVCDHHYLRALTLTTTWQRYTVLFSELSLEPGGDPVPTAFAADGVVSVQFRFNPGSVYDVWIDDVAFVR
jgi:hypothetical protein